MIIYLDAVMGLNFLVDLLLILGTNRLSGFPTGWKRAVAASLLGGAYGGLCLVPGLRFLGNILWRLVSLGLMGTMAFGWNRGALRRCAVFLMLSLALGGMAASVGTSSATGLVVSACGIWLLCRLAFGSGIGQRELVPVEIRSEDTTVCLTALKDTGNTLRDPISGEQVLVISAEAACHLTGLSVHQLRHPMETIARKEVRGLRVIPYRTVGGTGFLLAKVFPDVKIGTRRQKAVVAFDTGNLGKSEGYQALTGGII